MIGDVGGPDWDPLEALGGDAPEIYIAVRG